MNRRASNKFRLKKLLSGRTGTDKIKSLAELVGKLTKKNGKHNDGESSSEKNVGAELSERSSNRFKDKVSGKTDRSDGISNKGEETKGAMELNAHQKEGSSKAPVNRPRSKQVPSIVSEETKPVKSLSSKLANKPSESADEKRLQEFKKSCSSLKSTSSSSLSSVGGKGKSIFISDKLSQIESHLNGLAINGYLDAIEFIDYDLDETIRSYTTNELAEFERRLKKQRVKLDLYLFTFRHFHECTRQDALNAIDSVDLISKWATIKEEKIEFWSKLNESVYMKVEIESGNYDLVIKDENGGLLKFSKEHFHQIVKTFAMRIANYEHMLKSLDHYMDRISAKKHLTALNLTNLANFKGKKAAHKYLERSKNLV